MAGEAKTLVANTRPFVAAVKAGDIPLAKSWYVAARIHYERIEPIAEGFRALHAAIDARAGDIPSSQRWTGFQRLERDLWQRGDIRSSGPLADQLLADTKRLAATIKTTKITADQRPNGARSLLDEVAKTKVTGGGGALLTHRPRRLPGQPRRGLRRVVRPRGRSPAGPRAVAR